MSILSFYQEENSFNFWNYLHPCRLPMISTYPYLVEFRAKRLLYHCKPIFGQEDQNDSREICWLLESWRLEKWTRRWRRAGATGKKRLVPCRKERSEAGFFCRAELHSTWSWGPLANPDLVGEGACGTQRAQWDLRSKFLTHNCGWMDVGDNKNAKLWFQDCSVWYRNASLLLVVAVEKWQKPSVWRGPRFSIFFFLRLQEKQVGLCSLNNWVDILWNSVCLFAHPHSVLPPPFPSISLLPPHHQNIPRFLQCGRLISC